MKFKWEVLHIISQEKCGSSTHRVRVFGGWLVSNKSIIEDKNQTISESMVFVPDPNHEWTIEE